MKRIIITSVLTIFMVLSHVELSAQTFTLQGKVSDTDNNPIELVNVAVVNQGKMTMTSLKGEFKLILQSADSVNVRFSMVGYKSKVRMLRKPRGKQTLRVILYSENTLDEVQVQGERIQSDQTQNLRTKDMKNAGIADTGINKVVIITKLSRYDKIKRALNNLGVTGITVTQVSGCGIQKGTGEKYRGVEMDMTLLPKIKLEVVVSGIPVDSVIETAKKTLYTGKIGDGKIFVYPVSRVVKIRTGEENYDALQDVE